MYVCILYGSTFNNYIAVGDEHCPAYYVLHTPYKQVKQVGAIYKSNYQCVEADDVPRIELVSNQLNTLYFPRMNHGLQATSNYARSWHCLHEALVSILIGQGHTSGKSEQRPRIYLFTFLKFGDTVGALTLCHFD
jgi:hypothetical protein